MSKELRVALPVRLSELRNLAAMVEAFGDENQLPATKVFAINLELDELIANTVSYGNFGALDPKMEFLLRIEHGVLTLTMEDNGKPFDPTFDTEPNTPSPLESREVGGHGLHLVKSFADRVSYEYVEGKNRLTLEHELNPTLELPPGIDPNRERDILMDIEVVEERDRDNGVIVLLPVDRIDSTNARAFESIIMDRINNDERRLVIDFSHLNFISSSGLRVLLTAVKKLNANQGKLVLCDMQEHIHEVFQVCGFDLLIPIRDSRQSAMDVF